MGLLRRVGGVVLEGGGGGREHRNRLPELIEGAQCESIIVVLVSVCCPCPFQVICLSAGGHYSVLLRGGGGRRGSERKER